MSFLDHLLGKAIASRHEEDHKVGILSAIPMLGLDALGSAAYGPEAALTLLIPMGAAGLGYIGPITGIIVLLLAILYFSYRQTMFAYPGGGGSYTVAKENLGVTVGLFSAAALLVDYVLTAAVGISAGVGALVSAIPILNPYILPICLLVLTLITLVNLRGVRESGVMFAVPTYVFIGGLLGTIAIGVLQSLGHQGSPVAASPAISAPSVGAPATWWLLAKAFASGCTAMTGVEAVSNGITVFAKPPVKRAQQTLTAIVVVLGLMLLGIAYLCSVLHISAVDPTSKNYQSVLSQLVSAVLGRGILYYVVIASVLAVLALSANTGFADFPRLCRLLADDEYLPHTFANRGRRLVYSWGICILALLTGLILIVFGGITDRLIPLFAIGAFLAFTLSQAGMVQHWRRIQPGKLTVPLAVNLVGAVATGTAMLIILTAKFVDGAWITLTLIPGLVLLFKSVKRHYVRVETETKHVQPIQPLQILPPVVVVPLGRLSTISAKAVEFGMSISSEVFAVHISSDPNSLVDLEKQWKTWVEQPCSSSGACTPVLVVRSSPYRRLFSPLLESIRDIQHLNPGRIVAVVLPELVEDHWSQYLLHNQRATWIKAALLLHGDRGIVVINVPWYLRDADGYPTMKNSLL